MSPIPLLYSPDHKLHDPPFEHENGLTVPFRESLARIETIRSRLSRSGLTQEIQPASSLTLAELARTHSPAMLEFFQSTAVLGKPFHGYVYPEVFLTRSGRFAQSNHFANQYGQYCFDLYSPFGNSTWAAAYSSAGLAAAGADLLLSRENPVVYALTRPPGHHAGPDTFGGYCYLNNAAVAARRLTPLGRIAILDLDYHHGNGTQAIFWDDPQVLTVSIHVDPACDYPYYWGYAHETGGLHAPGTNLNVPLPPGTALEEYLAALKHALHAIDRFQPAAVILPLGFDTFINDPFSTFKLESEAYAHIGACLRAVDMPLLIVQEGGYATRKLGLLAENFLKGLLQVSGLPSQG